MDSNGFARRTFTLRLAAILPALGLAGTKFAAAPIPRAQESTASGEITHANEAIHQEVIFKAPRKKVYEALTDAKQFEKMFGQYVDGHRCLRCKNDRALDDVFQFANVAWPQMIH